MLRPTYLEVNLPAIASNARALLEGACGGSMLMAVVKANGYGHGSKEVARAALLAGAAWLGVALVEEGLELREAGITAPILVLGLTSTEGLYAGARANLSLCVCQKEQIEALIQIKQTTGLCPRAHLKLDSGMGRIGVRTAKEAVALFDLARAGGIEIEGVFTHFATADLPGGGAFVQEQYARFMGMAKELRNRGFCGLTHAAASAAAIGHEQTRLDMIRAGIALYGTDASGDLGLLEALCWKTQIAFIKELCPGDSVSYGRRYVAAESRRAATLPVGYADGYRRNMTGKAAVLIGGRRAPVLGTVCMDQIVVDISDLPGARVGDEAVLLGAQGDERITGHEMASWADTIHYEIYTGISGRVPRVYIDG